jgi:hypothetical protein
MPPSPMTVSSRRFSGVSQFTSSRPNGPSSPNRNRQEIMSSWVGCVKRVPSA